MRRIVIALCFMAISYLSLDGANTYADMYNRSQYNEVIVLCNSALSHDSNDFESWYYKGLSYKAIYNFALARESFENCKDIEPEDRNVRRLLANIYVQEGDIAKAQKVFLELVKLDSTDASSLIDLADIYKSEGEYMKTVDIYSQLVRLDSMNGYFYSKLGYYCVKSGLNEPALYYYKRAISLNASDYRSKRSLVNYLVKFKKYDEAEYFIDSFLVLYPKNIFFLKQKGLLMALVGNANEAVAIYKEVLALGDTSLLTCKYLGQSLYNSNNYEEAIIWLSRYLKVKNDDYLNHYILAIAYRQSYNYDKSIEHFVLAESQNYNRGFLTQLNIDKAEAYVKYGDYCGFRDSLKIRTKELYASAKDSYGQAENHCVDCSNVYLELAKFYESKINNSTTALYYYERYYNTKEFGDNDIYKLEWVKSKISELKEKLFFEE